MSLTPVTPQFSLKPFFQRTEGKWGAGVLALAALAGGYGFWLALPWLTAFAVGTFHLVIIAATLVGTLYLLTNRDFLSILKNGFQLVMRWSVGKLVELDPIGVEENYLDDMRVEKVKLDKGVEGCAEAKQGLETNIGKNTEVIQHTKSLISQVDSMITAERNPVKKNGYTLRRQGYLQEMGRKDATNKNLQKTLDVTNELYSKFQRMQQLADFNIDNLASQIDNDKQEHEALSRAYKALSPAQRLIRGEPEALKIFNASREAAARDNARMLGAMKDFSAYSEKYLTGMDIEQGAAAADAEQMLAGIEKTLQLTDGSHSSVVPQTSANTYVERSVPTTRNKDTSNYLD